MTDATKAWASAAAGLRLFASSVVVRLAVMAVALLLALLSAGVPVFALPLLAVPVALLGAEVAGVVGLLRFSGLSRPLGARVAAGVAALAFAAPLLLQVAEVWRWLVESERPLSDIDPQALAPEATMMLAMIGSSIAGCAAVLIAVRQVAQVAGELALARRAAVLLPILIASYAGVVAAGTAAARADIGLVNLSLLFFGPVALLVVTLAFSQTCHRLAGAMRAREPVIATAKGLE